MANSLNSNPCDQCEHYDPVMRGQPAKGGVRETVWAWCAVKSTYPSKEGPGQKFPENVKRVAEDSPLSEPYIVRRGQVVTNCTMFSVRSLKLSKSDLLKQLQDKTGGSVIGH